MKNIKLELSKAEYDALFTATQIFREVARDKKFYNIIKSTLGAPSLGDSQIYDEVCKPLLTVVNKVYIPKTSVSNETKKTSFFTEELPATTSSKMLYERVEHLLTSNLKYDQVNSTCISDVKVMLHRYKVVDDFIQSICPGNQFDTIDSKSSIELAKDICNWKPKK
jgi:hypothetical protein